MTLAMVSETIWIPSLPSTRSVEKRWPLPSTLPLWTDRYPVAQACRKHTLHRMRRLSTIPDDSAPDVDHPSGVQSRIRVFLPPEASTFMAKVQVPAKASVDESLQAPKGLARVGMAEVIHPSPYRLIHLLNKLCGPDWRPPLGEVLNPSSDVALRSLAGKDVDVPLAAFRRTSLHELEPDEVESFDQL